MADKDNEELIMRAGLDSLTPDEMGDRVVEILTRGVLRLIEKRGQSGKNSGIIPGTSQTRENAGSGEGK